MLTKYRKITCLPLWQGFVGKTEVQILTFLTNGLSICEIAKKLKLSEQIIRDYLAILKEDGLY